MAKQRLRRIALVALFFRLVLFSAPASAAYYISPSSCPYPAYAGCVMEITREPNWNRGDVISGGGAYRCYASRRAG